MAIERHGNLLGWEANYDVAVWVVQLFGDFVEHGEEEGHQDDKNRRRGTVCRPEFSLKFRTRIQRERRRSGRFVPRSLEDGPGVAEMIC